MSFPSFASGEVLTAADMNAVGLWLVKTQTIGTGVSSVAVTSAFSTNYDTYRIVVSGGVATNTDVMRLTLGSTTTGYYYGGKARTYGGADLNIEGANVGWWYAGETNAQTLSFDVNLINPFLSKQTLFSTTFGVARTDAYLLNVAGYLANTTSYTGFTITAGGGTMTGGTIRVYGYRN